jgi:[acyl-carrier-protein] S-malonyltransferase
MTAFVFPGQGSQYVGMAKSFAEVPAGKEMLEKADDILHTDLSRTMLEGPEDKLRQTEYTQPALFLHSSLALAYGGVDGEPTAMAGHSLGEFTALCAAGAFTFEDAISLVHLRGKLMAEAGKRSPGTMAAIIGMEPEKLTTLCLDIENETKAIVRPANFNSPGQIVVSGSVDGVREAIARAKAQGVRMAKELSVSGAFHSPLMQYAADGLKEALDSTTIFAPKIPVFANVTAEPHGTPETIRELLVRQLTAPVRWEETVKNMYDSGVREFVELGPGKVLQGLIGRTVSDVAVRGIENAPADQL